MCDLRLAVVVSYVLSLVSNALSASGVLADKNIGQISDEYPTYITPDGATFAIWGVIYVLETLLVVRQCCPTEQIEELLSQRCPCTGLGVRWRLIFAFLANAIWLPFYVNLYFSVALVIIVIYLTALVSVYITLNSRNTRSFWEWVQLAAGIACNISWLVVATSANAFTVFGELGWKDSFGVAGTPTAALAVIVAAAVLASGMALKRSDLAWSSVAVWAFLGVYRMQTTINPEKFPVGAQSSFLATGAFCSFVVVLMASAGGACLACETGPVNDKHEANSFSSQSFVQEGKQHARLLTSQ